MGKWISTKHRLPIENELVLAFYPLHSKLQDSFPSHSYFLLTFLLSKMWVDSDGKPYEQPLCWMSLDRPLFEFVNDEYKLIFRKDC